MKAIIEYIKSKHFDSQSFMKELKDETSKYFDNPVTCKDETDYEEYEMRLEDDPEEDLGPIWVSCYLDDSKLNYFKFTLDDNGIPCIDVRFHEITWTESFDFTTSNPEMDVYKQIETQLENIFKDISSKARKIYGSFDDLTEDDLNELIKTLFYAKGSKIGDETILKIVKHKNLSDSWLEDFCLSDLHPIEVIKHALLNPKIDSYLLGELYQRDIFLEKENPDWREIDHQIIRHPKCPEDIKFADITIYFDKLSTYNNLAEKSYDIYKVGDEYQGSISIYSFNDLKVLMEILSQTDEYPIDLSEIEESLLDVFEFEIVEKWIDNL